MPVPKKTNHTDPNILLDKINHEFPSLSWSSYQYNDQGWDHEVIILDKKLVFRFPVNPDYMKLLDKEVKVLKLINPLVSIKVPNYEHIAHDHSFAGYSYISGKTLYLEAFNNLDDVSSSSIASQLASFFSVIHKQNISEYTQLGVPITNMVSDQNHVKLSAQKYLVDVLSKRDFEEVTIMLKSVDNLLDKKLPNVFIHGDIYSSHILWDEKSNKVGLIDFSDMNIGDPAFDFAELFEYGRDFVEEVYKLYTGAKDNTFIDRAWVYQCWVSVFMMINYFETKKTTFEVAKQTFDRVKLK